MLSNLNKIICAYIINKIICAYIINIGLEVPLKKFVLEAIGLKSCSTKLLCVYYYVVACMYVCMYVYTKLLCVYYYVVACMYVCMFILSFYVYIIM